MITHDGTITFTHTNGRVYNVLPSHPSYTAVREKLREVAADDTNETLRLELFDLSQPKTIVHSSTGGRVRVEGNTVLYDGKPVRNFLAERIIWMIGEGFDAAPMLAFLEKVKLNPSNRAVDELYRFMEANKMGITKDGMILAYKRVRADYMDIYTGTIRNAIGDRPVMPRNEVNDDPTVTCSHGLHVCAMSYLPCYRGAPGNHVMICAIHPKDVVSVPIEYHNAKMRVSEYEVIGEIEDQLDDILGRTPVWDESDDDEDDWNDFDDHDDIDEEDENDDEQDCCSEQPCEHTAPVEPAKTLDEALSVFQPLPAGYIRPFTIASLREQATGRMIGPDGGVRWPRSAVPVPPADLDFGEFMDDIRNRVIDCITNELACIGGFSMDETLQTLGADELDATCAVMALETTFDLGTGGIGDDEITIHSTVGEIVALVASKV